PVCSNEKWEKVFIKLDNCLSCPKNGKMELINSTISELNKLILKGISDNTVFTPTIYQGIASTDRKLGLFLSALSFEKQLTFWKSPLRNQVIKFLDLTSNPDSVPIPKGLINNVPLWYAPCFAHTWSAKMQLLGNWSVQRLMGVSQNLEKFG